MKFSKMDKDSLEYYLKTVDQKYNCKECINQVKMGRLDELKTLPRQNKIYYLQH